MKQFNRSGLGLNLHYLSDSTHLEESFNPLFLYNSAYYAFRNYSSTQFNANLRYENQGIITGTFRMKQSLSASYLSCQNDYSEKQILGRGFSQSNDSDNFGLYSLDLALTPSFSPPI